MFDRLSSVQTDLALVVGGLRPDQIPLEQVDAWVEAMCAIERFGQAGKLLLADRASEVPRAGTVDRDAAGFLARVSGSSVGAARTAIETSSRLTEQPEVTESVRSGEMNEQRAHVVADAATAAPEQTDELLALARHESMKRFREKARTIKAAADARTAEEKHADLARTRRAHSCVTPEGAGRLEADGPPEQVAEIDAALAAHREHLFRTRSAAGTLEGTHGNLTFDALVAMARASVRGGDAEKPIAKKVLIRIDRSARLRGQAIAGETVDLPGYGPIPVGVAEELMRDQTWHAILTNGVAVLAVTHGKRKANAVQRTALDWTEPDCCVRGCPNPAYFEIDHIDEWGKTKKTRHGSLQRLCRFHHDLKTHFGYHYEPLPDGQKQAVSPDQQRQRRPNGSGPGDPDTPPPTGATEPSAHTDPDSAAEPSALVSA
jgi:hypothetical protein